MQIVNLTIITGVPAGMTAPLYWMSFTLWRLKDRFNVDQYRKTS